MSNYSSSIAKIANQAIYRSYGWMCFGLSFTGFISYFVSTVPNLQYLIFGSGILVPLLIVLAQFGIIISMGAMIQKMSYSTMVTLFTVYSFLNGLTLSIVFKIFQLDSIIGIFFLTAGIFGVMSLYGLFTRHNLNSFGVFAMSVLSGIFIISILNIFIKSLRIDFFMSFFAVIAISALISYDMQRIKKALTELAYDYQQQKKISIYAALSMYINFISLFVRLLHVLGKRRD